MIFPKEIKTKNIANPLLKTPRGSDLIKIKIGYGNKSKKICL